MRASITDFSGGIVNASNPLTMPDNASMEMLNYEYRDGAYPRYRKGVSLPDIASLGMAGIRTLEVWYPQYLPNDCVSDHVYVVHSGNSIRLVYKTATAYITTVVIDTEYDVTMFVSPQRVIMSDGENPCRQIYINKDGVIETGLMGMQRPLSMPTISESGSDNKYAKILTLDTGMAVERGNILQYCYTLEDKYGSESNPSPIATLDTMMYKYPSTDVTGYEWYWFETVVGNLSTSGYNEGDREKLKYYNLYRRDIRFSEGVIGTGFTLVKRVPVGTAGAVSVADSSSQSMGSISYDKGYAPPATSIVETNGVVYISGIKGRTIDFPFEFNRYAKITITNGNGTDYVNPIIRMVLDSIDIGIASWDYYLTNTNKVRLFFSDMTTPCQLMYTRVGTQLRCYVQLPYLNMETDTVIYLAFADTAKGITDAAWDSYRMGKFLDYSSNMSSQKMFSLNRVVSAGHKIRTVVPYPFAFIGDKSELFNLANMNAMGKVLRYGTASAYTPSEARKPIIPPYVGEQEIGVGSYMIPFDGTHIEYTLLQPPKLPLLINFQGALSVAGLASASSPYNSVIRCGNLHLTFYHRSSTGKVQLKLWNGVGSAEVLIAELISNASDQWRMMLSMYVSEGSVYILVRLRNMTNNSQWTYSGNYGTESLTLSNTVTMFEPYVSSPSYPSGKQPVSVALFDVIEMPTLQGDDISRACYYAFHNLTFFRTIIGATNTWTWNNNNILIEMKDMKTESNLNQVRWSGIYGSTFSALDYKNFKEPIVAILPLPSYMRMQYQNTILVFTRNTLSRIALSDDMKSLAQSASDTIEERPSSGLYAKKSLVSGGDSVYWLSEAGVWRMNANGTSNISRGIINVPIDKDAIGSWVDVNEQYMLYCPSTQIAYIYHTLNKAWTMFSGADIEHSHVTKMNLGAATTNKLLLIKGNSIVEYPSNTDNSNVPHRITTKQIYTGNMKPVRVRGLWDQGSDPSSILITAVSGMQDTNQSQTIASPKYHQWIYLQNGLWGAHVQISLDDVVGLTMIEMDIKEEI